MKGQRAKNLVVFFSRRPLRQIVSDGARTEEVALHEGTWHYTSLSKAVKELSPLITAWDTEPKLRAECLRLLGAYSWARRVLLLRELFRGLAAAPAEEQAAIRAGLDDPDQRNATLARLKSRNRVPERVISALRWALG